MSKILICITFCLAVMSLSVNGLSTPPKGFCIDSVKSTRLRAYDAYNHNRINKAIDLYRQTIALGDSSTLPFYNLACCYCLKGQTQAALEYLQQAAGNGYCNYNALWLDRDLYLLQKDNTTAWQAICAQVSRNAEGKIPVSVFDQQLKQTLLHADTATLSLLCSPAFKQNTTNEQRAALLKEIQPLMRTDSLYPYSTETFQCVNLYEKKHMLRTTYQERAFPVPYFDPEFARLLSTIKVHYVCRSVDNLYTQLDTLWIEKNNRLPNLEEAWNRLSDSVKVLAIVTDGNTIHEYEDLQDKPQLDKLKEILTPLPTATPQQIAQAQKNGGKNTHRFLRITALPVKSTSLQIKIAFYKGKDTALIMIGEHYGWVNSKKIKKIEKWIEQLTTENPSESGDGR